VVTELCASASLVVVHVLVLVLICARVQKLELDVRVVDGAPDHRDVEIANHERTLCVDHVREAAVRRVVSSRETHEPVRKSERRRRSRIPKVDGGEHIHSAVAVEVRKWLDAQASGSRTGVTRSASATHTGSWEKSREWLGVRVVALTRNTGKRRRYTNATSKSRRNRLPIISPHTGSTIEGGTATGTGITNSQSMSLTRRDGECEGTLITRHGNWCVLDARSRRSLTGRSVTIEVNGSAVSVRVSGRNGRTKT
jgi:hypothetical protein